MYPPLLVLHSNLGRLLLDTRVRTMAEAAKNANRTGYHGYRFPWESALTGWYDMVVLNFLYGIIVHFSEIIVIQYVIYLFNLLSVNPE